MVGDGLPTLAQDTAVMVCRLWSWLMADELFYKHWADKALTRTALMQTDEAGTAQHLYYYPGAILKDWANLNHKQLFADNLERQQFWTRTQLVTKFEQVLMSKRAQVSQIDTSMIDTSADLEQTWKKAPEAADLRRSRPGRSCYSPGPRRQLRATNEQCSWFGEHVSVFVVSFGVRILNVFGFVFGVLAVRCSGIVLCCSVFGFYVLFFSVSGMVVCSVFGQAGSPSLSSGLGQEGVFMNACSCFVRARVRVPVFCSCACSGSLCSCSCLGDVWFCS